MRTIALANQKGGTGKTTTAVNLGAALAEKGRRVLLIDLDPQAHLTAHLGIEDASPTVASVLMGRVQLPNVIRETAVARLDLVPSGLDLAGAEVALAEQVGRDLVLRRAFVHLPDRYDYVFIDCPPSLGLLTVNALAAVSELFIPVQLEWLALRALSQLLETVDVVRERLNPDLQITGVIACMYKARRLLCAQVMEALRDHFGDLVFETVIRENIRLAEAPSHGLPVTVYDPGARGTEDYRRLALEVMKQERGERRQGR
ncbi:MAG: ParA family protein [Armatimonadetes bacterium]|nr:ParA family protein [Armatimonadota bacterium]